MDDLDANSRVDLWLLTEDEVASRAVREAALALERETAVALESDGVPDAFCLQAARMPTRLRRLLVQNECPTHVSAAAVLRASGVHMELLRDAWKQLARPEAELLMRLPAALACVHWR